MPLRARLGDIMLDATDTSLDWNSLKGRKPRPVLICGIEAVAKASHLGTQFFADLHRDDDFEHKGESPEHLRIKGALGPNDTGLHSGFTITADRAGLTRWHSTRPGAVVCAAWAWSCDSLTCPVFPKNCSGRLTRCPEDADRPYFTTPRTPAAIRSRSSAATFGGSSPSASS